ncbi:hypothetical protein [Lysinibacillus sp. 3P01SB]|uniref:hypothetical protein n=1 Tax=Lysinibacillus sp. 3P01SB TaxID=3132284 RepID=UPI0039A6E2A2
MVNENNKDKTMKKIAFFSITFNFFVLIIATGCLILGPQKLNSIEEVLSSLKNFYIENIVMGTFLYLIAWFFLLTPKIFLLTEGYNKNIKMIFYISMNLFGTILQVFPYFLFSLIILSVYYANKPIQDSTFFFNVVFILTVLAILDLVIVKASEKLDKFFCYLIKIVGIKINYEVLKEKEKELRGFYNCEKWFSIIATITTILVIADAAGLAAFPLQPKEGETYFNAYLESDSYIYMLVFVGATLAYLKELIIGVIPEKKRSETI